MTHGQKLKHVKEYTNQKCTRVFFQKTFMSDWAKSEINRLNLESSRRWSYKHLLQGFDFATAPKEIEGVTPILDTDDAVRMCAYARHLVGM